MNNMFLCYPKSTHLLVCEYKEQPIPNRCDLRPAEGVFQSIWGFIWGGSTQIRDAT